jgi:hypothetical protein
MLRVLLLVVLVGVALAAPRAWLEGPVAVADNRALRLDVQTASILLRAQVTGLVVCSAVDQPMVAYDESNPSATGCNSPGYRASQVYPRGPSDSKFHVRQRSRSLYIKRRLLDPVSPTVWLQATIEVRDERGVIVEPAHVAMTRFQVPERALAIGQSVPVTAGQEDSGIADSLLKFFHLRDHIADDVDAEIDYDVLDGRDTNNGTSTRFYHHIHWTTYSAGLFGCLFLTVLVVAGAVYRARSQHAAVGRGKRRSDNNSDYENGQNEVIVEWMQRGVSQGLYHDPRGFDPLDQMV